MKFYLFALDEIKSKDNKTFYKAYVLDYSNKVVSECFIDSELYDYYIELLEGQLFVDISDNVVLTYNKSKQCYILSYKR